MGDIKKVFACFKELKIKPNVDSFENRVRMQKAVCILDMMGVKTGFRFGMYVRGPYSPDLTKEIFSNVRNFEKIESEGKLTSQDRKNLEFFSDVMRGMDAPMLEIAATFAFLAYGEKKMPYREALEEVRKLKHFYSSTQLLLGVNKAKELLFVPTEEDKKIMKEEFALWEKASDADFAKVNPT